MICRFYYKYDYTVNELAEEFNLTEQTIRSTVYDSKHYLEQLDERAVAKETFDR